jgi:hypothetical protein
VAAHYAISSMFSSFAEETDLFCYRVRRISYEVYNSGAGGWRWAARILPAQSPGSSRASRLRFCTFGDQNITAAVKPYTDADAAEFEDFAAKATEQVQRALFP